MDRTHLKRCHVPLECRNCGATQHTLTAFRQHYDANVECQEELPIPEGVDNDKMELINQKNITWGQIYDYLFPGEPVPDPRKF